MDAARDQKRGLAIHAVAREAENMAVNCHKLASLYGVFKRGAKNDLKEQMEKRLKLVDPQEPEKPKPAYNYFIKENYPVIRKKSPDNSNRENMKELAALWRKTRAEDKKHYEDLADIDKKRYGTEYRKYVTFRLKHPYYPEKHGVTMNIKKLQQKKQAKADASGINSSIEKKEKVKEEEGLYDENDRVATSKSSISESSTTESSDSESLADSESSTGSSLVSVSLPVTAASYTTSHDINNFDDFDDFDNFDDFDGFDDDDNNNDDYNKNNDDDDELDDTETSTSATKPANTPKPKLVSLPSNETQNKNNNNTEVLKSTKKKRFLLGTNRQQRRRQRRRVRQKQQNGKDYDSKKKTKGDFKWQD